MLIRIRSIPALVLLQMLLVTGGIGFLALCPPVRGPMLMLALDGRDAGRMAGAAVSAGANIRGRGPLANMLIVDGDRARLLPVSLDQGALLLAAPVAWCGSSGTLA